MVIALTYMDYDHATQPYLRTAAHRLREVGVEVELYSRSEASGLSDSVHVLRGPSGWGGIRAALQYAVRARSSDWRWIRGLGNGSLRDGVRRWVDLQRLIRARSDLIHLQNAGLYTLLRGFLIETGIPFVVSFRGHDTVVRPHLDLEWKRVLCEIYERASALHFVSCFLKSRALQLGACETKCIVIRPGVDTKLFERKSRRDGCRTCRLITVGRLVWEKALHMGLLVIRSLVDRGMDVEYHVVGDGPSRVELEFWSRELGLKEHVKWHGTLDQVRMRDVLEQGDVYLHPSVSDSLPVAILEAMAMGLPVVATRVGGIAEAVIDGETGFLMKFGDVDGMAAGILRLWADANLREAFGKAGRLRATSEFSVEREVQEWAGLYRRLITGFRLSGVDAGDCAGMD